MSGLIRNSSHGNNISVLHLEAENVFRKISRNVNGRKFIKSEKAGIDWYTNLFATSSAPLISNIWDSSAFTRLDIVSIQGKQVFYNAPISKTYSYLQLCMEHYFEVWPKKMPVPAHGDLTLDNVIFTSSNTPVFFDWEHFSEEGECWGFDLAYLLLSAIVLPSPEKIQLDKNERNLFLELWKNLAAKKTPSELIENPVRYFRNVFSTRRHWQEIVSRSPRKLYPMWMARDDEVYITEIIKTGR